MWLHHLDMLADNQLNRFSLSFGIGYDFLRAVTDAYFLFAYPFFLAVPGYNVRAVNLSDVERDRNLETLRFISEQTASRCLQFQLGLWMHGYDWPEIYTNQSIVEPSKTEYSDTPPPKTFGNTSPHDPQLFSRISDFADELLKSKRSGKYSPCFGSLCSSSTK